jgi:putative ABC transport system permease protein
LVNEAFARRFFPQGNPIGEHINLNAGSGGSSPRCEIVGVVGNVKEWFDQPGFSPQLYAPFLQAPDNGMTLVIRTKGDAATLASAVRAAVWSVDKDQPVGIMTMTQFMQNSGVGGEHVMCELLAVFGALALILAAVGVYGIIAQAVAQRTLEIGIRMALGAGRRNVLRVVVGEGMRLAAFGLLIGLAFASTLPRLFDAVFEGFNVHAAWISLIAPLLVAFVALLASYLPARRAARVDPMVALRYG